MRGRKEDKGIVFQSLAMVTQFSMNMLVPICMMSALGVWLDRKLDTVCFTIILFAAGAAAGGQNVYRMAKRIGGGDGPEEAESERRSAGTPEKAERERICADIPREAEGPKRVDTEETAADGRDQEREAGKFHESDRALEKHE